MKTHLSEVTRMVLVEIDTVVVHTSGVTATSRMLPVLACKQKVWLGLLGSRRYEISHFGWIGTRCESICE